MYKTMDLFERIRLTLALNQEQFLSILKIPANRYLQLCSRNEAPPRALIECLADELSLCPEKLREGKIDYVALLASFSGNPTLLPEKYAIGGRSKRRTSIHILNSIEVNYGWRAREKILRKFQLNESMFFNLDASIHIQFLVDLCDAVQAIDGRKGVLFNMGLNSVHANYYSPLGKLYQSLEGPKQIYEKLYTELASIYYDTNTSYRLLELSESHCLVEVTPSPELKDEIHSSVTGSQGTCEQKRGAFASFPMYRGLSPATVHELECIYRGGTRCLFHINFEISATFAKKRSELH